MKLLTLKLRNFKCYSDFLLEPDGRDLSIYADNEIGKTTLYDAQCWLLYGKDSLGQSVGKHFRIKPIDPLTGEDIHHLETEVVGTFELPDGSIIELAKLYKEDWTQKRGNARSEFAGHTIDHKVNKVPVKESQYAQQVAEICPSGLQQDLTNALYFSTQKSWQDRRKMLLDVCGDVSDEDVIASTPALAELPGLLEGRSLDDQRKVLTARRKEINSDLDKIPVRIDELSRMPKPEAPAFDVKALRIEIASLEGQKARMAAGGEIAELNKQLAQQEAKLQIRKNELTKAQFEDADGVRAKLSEAETQLSSVQGQISRLNIEIEACDNGVASVDRQLEALRAEFATENAKTFAFSGEDTCAACGQALPAEKVEAARALAEEQFNSSKARKLEANQTEGKALKGKRDIAAGKAETGRAKVAEFESQITSLAATRDGFKEQLDSAAPSIIDPLLDPQCAAITGQIADINSQISKLTLDLKGQVSELDSKISDANQNLEGVQSAEAARSEFERSKLRTQELKAQEKTLVTEIEKIDKALFLTDAFIRAKVGMLEEKINSRFKIARFKLFEQQINGGLTECLETTYKGVPWGSMNTAAKINVGLDICATLGEHFGFTPPIFVDGAESVTNIFPTPAQQIRLVVSGSDKSLRVEAAQKEGVAA